MRLSPLAGTLVVAALALTPASATAQGTVTGVLLDSLRAGQPIVGAAVHIDDADAALATTDAQGRFTLRGLELRGVLIRVKHPRLDSLGLGALERSVELAAGRDSVHLALATPSFSDVLRLLCGGSAEHPGVFGVVTDIFGNRLPNAEVQVSWSEQRMAPGERSLAEGSAKAVTDANGVFTVCAAPAPRAVIVEPGGRTRVTSVLRLRAQRAALRSYEIELDAADAASVSIALRVAEDSIRRSTSGTILDSLGRPLAGARVSVLGDPEPAAVSDADGYFRLSSTPAATHQYTIRAIGYSPLTVTAASDDGHDIALGEIQLGPVPPLLDTVRVVATQITRQQREFAERRRVLSGTFLDESDIARLPKLTSSFLASRVSRAMILSTGPSRAAQKFVFRRPGLTGEDVCSPRVFVDGQDFRDELGMDEIDVYLQIAKRVEVYRASFAPADFVDFNGCGSLVIWTQ